MSEAAQKAKKTYGLHPDVVRDTNRLVSREAPSVAQQAAERRILAGGVYSIGALSLAVNEGSEEDVFAVLTGAEGNLRDGRTGVATWLFVELMKRFPDLQKKVLASEFPRDRLIVLAAATGPQVAAVVDSLKRRPLPPHFLSVVKWLTSHRSEPIDVEGLVEPAEDAGSLR
jgi:hypothetical protein